MAASASAPAAAAAAATLHEFDVWVCGSCIVLGESGADVPLKLFARACSFGFLRL
jgi:hypothetical protein